MKMIGYSTKFKILPSKPGITVDDILKEIQGELYQVSACNVRIYENAITFTGGIFRLVMNWNLLVPISSGEIQVDMQNQYVSYTIRFTELVITAAVMFLFALPIMIPDLGIFRSIFSVLFLLLLVVGANWITSIIRFEAFVKRCMVKAGVNVTY